MRLIWRLAEIVFVASGSQITTVGIGADGDGALARIDVEDAGDIGRGHRDELLLGQPAGIDARRPQHGHAVLEPAGAVRDLAEVAWHPCASARSVKEQWSVATTCSEPDCRPAHSKS